MKIYIMTDMEGAAGIINSDDYCTPSGRYYMIARKIVTEETYAAIEGLIEAGADDFLVVNSHGYGAIDPLLLHPSAKLLAGRPLEYPFGCDETFDAAIIIGQHTKAILDRASLRTNS
ncbi:M55 family metallopeptidase [Candidatus Bathyarchaeota archaeon]|nr:M55 family metallopeptidase [Candidatus Bathyarchaeota archaeon]